MVAEERGWRLAKNYAVGMMFLSQNEEEARLSRRIVEEELQNETLSIVGWREVPTNPDVLGEIALSPCRASSKSSLTPRPAGARAIWSAACSWRAAASKNGCRTTASTSAASPTW